MARGTPTEMWRQKIRVLLRARGMKQTDLTKAIDSSPSLLAKWLNGTTRISYPNAVAVARVFGVTTDELMNDEPLPLSVVRGFFGDTPGPVATPAPTPQAPAATPQPTSAITSGCRMRAMLHNQIDAIPDDAIGEAFVQMIRWYAGRCGVVGERRKNNGNGHAYPMPPPSGYQPFEIRE